MLPTAALHCVVAAAVAGFVICCERTILTLWSSHSPYVYVRQVIQALEKRISTALAAEAEARAISDEFLNALIEARVRMVDHGIALDPLPTPALNGKPRSSHSLS